MNFKEIQELIRLVSKSDLASFKMKDGEFEISIKTPKAAQYTEYSSIPVAHPIIHSPQMPAAPAPAPSSAGSEAKPAPSPSSGNLVEVKSPMVGTFYRSPGPDKAPFVKVGDTVSVGSTVCIVEAMKLFNEIECEVSGTIVQIKIEDASPVEYDQVLFVVDTGK